MSIIEEEETLVKQLSENLPIEYIAELHEKNIPYIQDKIRKIAQKKLIAGESPESIMQTLKLSREMITIITLQTNNKILRDTNLYLRKTVENMEETLQNIIEQSKITHRDILKKFNELGIKK
jgi:hypothetical protein